MVWLFVCYLLFGQVLSEASFELGLTPDSDEDQPMATYSSCMYLKDADTWDTLSSYADSIGTGPISLELIVSGGNRIAPVITSSRRPTVPSGSWKHGFEWQSGDQSVEYWVPQGMTQGELDDGTYVAFVAWYYTTDVSNTDPNPPVSPYDNKGVRLAILNLTQAINGDDSAYRLALLVQPTGKSTYEPVVNHAGGIVYLGNYLYEADTDNGMRVFDLSNIREVSTDSSCDDQIGYVDNLWCAYGYKYIVPQVSKYTAVNSEGTTLSSSSTCFAKFSWLGKDTTQSSYVILSGEYCNDGSSPCTADPDSEPGMGGRLYRWQYDSDYKLVEYNTSLHLVKTQKAYFMNKRNVQGVAPVPQTSTLDDYRLSSSRDYGSLYLINYEDSWVEYDVGLGDWVYYPETMHASTQSSNLWVSTEGRPTSDGSYYTNPSEGGRCVFAVDSDVLYD